jgi:hypothetical protein
MKLSTAENTASRTGAEFVAWDSLIHIKRDESLIEPGEPAPAKPAPALMSVPAHRLPWRFLSLALGSAAVGFFALGVIVIVITIKSRDWETKITLKKDVPVEVETPDRTIEHTPKDRGSVTGGTDIALERPSATRALDRPSPPPSAPSNSSNWMMQYFNFELAEHGMRRKDFAIGETFTIEFRLQARDGNVFVNGERTAGVRYTGNRPCADVGALGLFVRSGTVVIKSLVVSE